ncbi:MAG: DUF488 domain-containing protein [Pseudomonadales bacterium]|jgi:uncharacterized protein YeaO (DUF488 family)|nr:DUF488 domain-containing protein [Pseudomonadales bacterium]
MIRIKRTYEPRARGDGRRILVERLWPRGMKKEALHADAWLKDVAPSTELRKWFGHRVERWPEFRRRYRKELDANSNAWAPILAASRKRTVTLLYSAHDTAHNGARVLCEYLSGKSESAKSRERAPSA